LRTSTITPETRYWSSTAGVLVKADVVMEPVVLAEFACDVPALAPEGQTRFRPGPRRWARGSPAG
jgi:hypothetical protein